MEPEGSRRTAHARARRASPRMRVAPTPVVPGTITAIDAAVRRPGRFALAIDGRHSGFLSLEAVDRLALRVGGVVDARCALAIDEAVALTTTHDRALAMLAARSRSAAELRRLLLRKGEPASAVELAVGRLRDAGFLDDERFARQYAHAKAAGAGMSRRRISAGLGRLGVAREVAEQAIEEVFADERIDETAALERVAEKKLRTLAKLDAPIRRRRLYAFLARRGHSPDAIAAVIKKLAV
jgi:SOS response regulatory protein OraA/RecX